MTLFHPLKFMLASPAEDAHEIVRRLGPEVWVEDKYDGIRAQLHKQGRTVRLFSRDLHDVTGQFPEVAVAARDPVVGRHPRWRDPRLEGRRRAAVRVASRPGSDGRRLRPRSRPRSRSSSWRSTPWPSDRAMATAVEPLAARTADRAPARLDALDLPTVDDRRTVRPLEPLGRGRRGRAGGGLHRRPGTTERGPHGQGPGERLLARPPRAGVAEDEEGAGHHRLRRRRRRGRSRQAPRRAERLHVCRPRHRARPPRHDRQGLQRPDRRGDRRDDPLVRGAHGRPVRPLPPGRADGRRRDRLRRHPALEPPQVGVQPALPAHRRASAGQVARRDRHASRPSPRCTRASRRAPSTW